MSVESDKNKNKEIHFILMSRVTRIRTKKYILFSCRDCRKFFNTLYYTMYWLHVESVKSDKNKNKEISKKYILFSCRDCREFNQKITLNQCITCREWPFSLQFTMYILIQSLPITIFFELKLRITRNFKLNLQITTTLNIIICKWLRISETSN